MATVMTDDERRAFLSAGTRTGVLSTVRKDGTPHAAPIWFVLDGDDVIFTTGVDTVKGKAISRDNRVALCVDDDSPPFSFVTIEGVARIGRDLDELLVWATRLGARYMGAERAEEFGRRNAVPGELLVRVAATRVIAKARISD
jgi:PPOX class probable F420-dependent enzyme